MQPEQSSMTVITSVLRGREKSLKNLLTVIGRDIEGRKGNTQVRLAQFTTIHFARWVVIPPPDTQDPGGPPSLLAFGTDHDGSDETLLRTLADEAMDALDAVYSHCEGWPGPGDKDQVVQYLLGRRIPYGARHIACRRRTVQQLKDAAQARDRMEAYIDTVVKPARAGQGQALAGSEAARAISAIRAGASPVPSIPSPPLNWQLPVAIAGAVGVVGGGLSLLARRSPLIGLLGSAALVWLGKAAVDALHRHEDADRQAWKETTPPTLEHLRELRVWEDHKVQNQMTHVVPVKPGRFRRVTLNVVLAAIDFLARFHWNRGELGGIPTIHFARWMLIDGGERLLFFSNFDGSWENYLGDFIDRASAGLTGVWSNAVEFPPAHNLIRDGSQRAEAFKNWTRKYQIETQVWYSAYPDVSVVNQLDALRLCQAPARGAEADLLGAL